MAFTVTVHAAVGLLLLIPLGGNTLPMKQTLVALDLPTPGPSATARPKAPQPRKVPPTPPREIVVPPPRLWIPTDSPQVAALLAQSDAQAASGGCDLTAPIQAALQASPDVQKALPLIPAERRSVANALALWNQAWIEPDNQLVPVAIDAIRNTVAATIAAASDACRLQPQAGPRLMFLPGAHNAETTVLALGSGEWTWQQVADTAVPPSIPGEGTTALAAAAPTTFPRRADVQ